MLSACPCPQNQTRRIQPRERVPCEACTPDRIPHAPANSLPQLGQVRWGSVFMVLTVLQPKETPRSTEWCEIGRPLANCCHVPQAIAYCIILARQITFLNKIPTVGVLRPPLRWFETSSRTPPIVDFAANRSFVRRSQDICLLSGL